MSFAYQPFTINIPWFFRPNAQGLSITTDGDIAHVSRTSGGAQNQWTLFKNPTVVSPGWTVEFDIRYISLNPITEVKLTLIYGLILRYDEVDRRLKYQWFNSAGQFVTIANSTATLGASNFTSVSLSVQSDGIEISEGGTVLGKWNTAISTSEVEFSWQILNASSTFQGEFKNVTARAPLPN